MSVYPIRYQCPVVNGSTTCGFYNGTSQERVPECSAVGNAEIRILDLYSLSPRSIEASSVKAEVWGLETGAGFKFGVVEVQFGIHQAFCRPITNAAVKDQRLNFPSISVRRISTGGT